MWVLSDVQWTSPLSRPFTTPKLSVRIVSGRAACSDVLLSTKISHLLTFPRCGHCGVLSTLGVLLRDRKKFALSHIQRPQTFPGGPFWDPSITTVETQSSVYIPPSSRVLGLTHSSGVCRGSSLSPLV